MNYPPNDIPDRVRDVEETLRLIARIPAPQELVSRVQANLRTAPAPSFLGGWRAAFHGWMYSPALRGLAAAAIVCVVAGGGWGIYSHVQPPPTSNAIEVPARVGNSGAFSNAGAMRKPDTVNGPVLAHPVAPEAQKPPAIAPDAKSQSIVPKAAPPAHKKFAKAHSDGSQASRAK